MRHAEFHSTNGDPVEGDKEEDAVPVKRGFAYLKRDLVRLLGILCWQDKSVQDRIRSCGGIPVVMNLCVVDERNPCKFYRCLLFMLSPNGSESIRVHQVGFHRTSGT